jgi:predicted esterase
MKIISMFSHHFAAFWRGICRIFGPHYSNVPFERIVVIVGIKSSRGYMRPFVTMLRRNFPQAEIVLVQKYYFHHQADIVDQMITESVHALSTDKKTLVFGHSFGGIIARAAIARSDVIDHILLLATLGTPHGMRDFGVHEAMTKHEVPHLCAVPVLTFGGRADAVVPDEFSSFDGEVDHVSLSCMHSAFVRTSRTRKEVISAVMQYLVQK